MSCFKFEFYVHWKGSNTFKRQVNLSSTDIDEYTFKKQIRCTFI